MVVALLVLQWPSTNERSKDPVTVQSLRLDTQVLFSTRWNSGQGGVSACGGMKFASMSDKQIESKIPSSISIM